MLLPTIFHIIMLTSIQISLLERKLVTSDCRIHIPYPLIEALKDEYQDMLKCHYKLENLSIADVEGGGVHELWDATGLLEEYLANLNGAYRNSTSAMWARSRVKHPPPAFVTLTPLSGGAPAVPTLARSANPATLEREEPKTTSTNASTRASIMVPSFFELAMEPSVSSSSASTRPSTTVLIPFSGRTDDEPLNVPVEPEFDRFYGAAKEYIEIKMKSIERSSPEEMFETFNNFSHGLIGYSLDLSKSIHDEAFQNLHAFNHDPNVSRDMWGITLFLYHKYSSKLSNSDSFFLDTVSISEYQFMSFLK
jgi:hypothetical protein